MSEGVARIEDERVKRACALGLGAAGGYACAATLARMGAATSSALGGVGTVVGALAGALGGAVLGGLIGEGWAGGWGAPWIDACPASIAAGSAAIASAAEGGSAP
ncbi:hypothetical protein C3B79_0427 [Aeromonas hydrophila]|nr:hypothetical protein C3B79_0427 [Aeromonas hydrophila]